MHTAYIEELGMIGTKDAVGLSRLCFVLIGARLVNPLFISPWVLFSSTYTPLRYFCDFLDQIKSKREGFHKSKAEK